MIGTISPNPASLPREAVRDPCLKGLDVSVDQPDVRLGRNQEGRRRAPCGPLVTALIEAVVDPGQRAARVFVESVELPVRRPELRSPVEGQVGELGNAQDAGKVI